MYTFPTARPKLCSAWLPAALGLFITAPALAQTYFYTEVSASARHTEVNVANPFVASEFDAREGGVAFGRLSALADSDYQQQTYNGLGQSWSEVAVGAVHLYALAQSVASGQGPTQATGSGRAVGFVSDFFGLSVPGQASGAAFTVTAQVRVDGSAVATTTPGWNGMFQQNRADGFSDWQSWVRVNQGVNGPTLAELRAGLDCQARTSFGTPPGCVSSGLPGMRTITFPMVNGALLQLDMRGWASAGTSVNLSIGQVSADSWSDLGNTIAWGGITELRDANNQLVTNFSAFSASSGFDYRNAYVSVVPELPTPVLVVLGLGLMGLLGLRRGHSGRTVGPTRTPESSALSVLHP